MRYKRRELKCKWHPFNFKLNIINRFWYYAIHAIMQYSSLTFFWKYVSYVDSIWMETWSSSDYLPRDQHNKWVTDVICISSHWMDLLSQVCYKKHTMQRCNNFHIAVKMSDTWSMKVFDFFFCCWLLIKSSHSNNKLLSYGHPLLTYIK